MKDVKKLEGWLTFAEAGEHINMSKQGFHKVVFLQRQFDLDDIRAIGSKPIYLVRESSVLLFKEARRLAELDRSEMIQVLREASGG